MQRWSAWEQALLDAAAWTPGLWLVKTEPRVKTIGRRVVRTGEGPPDFMGVWHGRAVVVEAKSSERAAWPLEKLEQHQRDQLAAAHRAGAIVGLALEVGSARGFMPWPAVLPYLDGSVGRASIPAGAPGWVPWAGRWGDVLGAA